MEWQLATWEEELAHKNSELLQSKKLAAIGTLASGVAHELNNPLNNIYLSAQVLKRRTATDSPPEVVQTVDDILGQTVRVKGIVSDLLEFARERPPHLREVNLAALVRSAYDLLRRTVHVAHVRFTVEAAGDGPVVMADPDQLERVFINLFSNAVAAMPMGGSLTVSMEPRYGVAVVRVADTGQGLSPEDREKIFDPFFTKKASGTGLGLAIVLNIVRKHGGTINVASHEGAGTVFEITLPEKGVPDEV
jgi:signal transduction histidine kinase